MYRLLRGSWDSSANRDPPSLDSFPFAENSPPPAHNTPRGPAPSRCRLNQGASMRNITVSINDQVYHDVRVWCAKRDTSVSAVVQRFLEDLPRLKQARHFPLPEAPPPRSLAPLIETLE